MGFWKKLFAGPEAQQPIEQQATVRSTSAPAEPAFVASSTNGLLTENDVIRAVSAFLQAGGYQILSSATTEQHGVDIVARSVTPELHDLYIEAKGATSSKEGTARAGQAFTDSQQLDHISKAIYASMKAYSTTRPSDAPNREVGIALPVTMHHERHIGRIRPALKKFGIRVYWVSQDGNVTVE